MLFIFKINIVIEQTSLIMEIKINWGELPWIIGRSILALLLGWIAAMVLNVELALMLLKNISHVFLGISSLFLATLFFVVAGRAARVLTRGFTTISLLLFLLIPVGKMFRVRLAWRSAGEVDLVYKPQNQTELLLGLLIDVATYWKVAVALGSVVMVLAFLSWAQLHDE